MLKWTIKRVDGRYVHLPDKEPGTVLFFPRRDLASVFEGTRDLVDGIIIGLKGALGSDFVVEPLIHIQKPADEKQHTRLDDVSTGI